MIITHITPLNLLAEYMGDTATNAEAEAMRDLLCADGREGSDVSEIPEEDWCRYLCQAVEQARAS